MEMEFGKNYVVTGLGSFDEFSEDVTLMVGMVVTPMDADTSKKYDDFYALCTPRKTIFSEDGWRGDFQVISVPDASMEYAVKQHIEPGNWISFVDVYLEEVK